MICKNFLVIFFVVFFISQKIICMNKIKQKKAERVMWELIEKKNKEENLSDGRFNFLEDLKKDIQRSEKEKTYKEYLKNRIQNMSNMLSNCQITDLQSYFGLFTSEMITNIFYTCKTDQDACDELTYYVKFLKKKKKKFLESLHYTTLIFCVLFLYMNCAFFLYHK